MSRTPARRRRSLHAGPIVAFLLIASFGIMFAGCTAVRGPEEGDELSFTEEDVARFREETKSIVPKLAGGSGVELKPDVSLSGATMPGSRTAEVSSISKEYDAIRAGGMDTSGTNLYRVTNTFLNVREAANNSSAVITKIDEGALLTAAEFVNASWAKVTLGDGRTGYVSARYISKLTSEENLAKEKKAYDGLYFVNFAFVNVRESADQQSAKIGEIPGQAFVRPIAIDGQWAKIPFEGKEAYVSLAYLSPFMPTFLVRQVTYDLPILRYQANQEGVLKALQDHVTRLQKEGMKILSLREFADILIAQESRDVRLPAKSVVLTIVGVTPENVRQVSDTVAAMGGHATVFVESRHIGISGITEKLLTTLIANGADVQSGGHTGDDLRSLTNAQLDLELHQSRKILEDATGRSILAVAYPLGGVNDRVITEARTAGYLLGLAAAPERSFSREDLLKLPSVAVGTNLTSDDVLKIALGQ